MSHTNFTMSNKPNPQTKQSAFVPLLVILLIRFMPSIIFVSGFVLAFIGCALALFFIRGNNDLMFLAVVPALAFGFYAKSRTKVSSKIDFKPIDEDF